MTQVPVRIDIHPFLLDHRIDTGPVLPAVHSMQLLAANIEERFPQNPLHLIRSASFGKLLSLPINTPALDAFIETEVSTNGDIRASLITKIRSKSGIIRNLQHAAMVFQASLESKLPLHKNLHCTEQISINDIYPGLVIFGRQFQNLAAPVDICPEGATAQVTGGEPTPAPTPLGSPFPLDAAFHAACAWGKHYTGRICYPVSFNRRWILKPTQADMIYKATIRFRGEQASALTFDLTLTDATDKPCEVMSGLLMKEI